jgi:hypothetical protein
MPIINGPGFYRTRDGREIEIEGFNQEQQKWEGVETDLKKQGLTQLTTWLSSGHYYRESYPGDNDVVIKIR